MNLCQIRKEEDLRVKEISNNNVIDRVKELYKYLKSTWKMDHIPSITQVKYELGYDISFEMGFKTIIDFRDLFEEGLQKLVKLHEVIVYKDHRKIRRIYPPEEKIIKKFANKLYKFLEPIWEKTYIPTKMAVYEEFGFKNNISRDQFEKVVTILEDFKVIELLPDSSNGIRIIKSRYSDTRIVNILKCE